MYFLITCGGTSRWGQPPRDGDTPPGLGTPPLGWGHPPWDGDTPLGMLTHLGRFPSNDVVGIHALADLHVLRRRGRGEGTRGPPTTSTGTPQPLGGALPSAGAPSPCGASPPTWAGQSSVLQESGEAQPHRRAQRGRPHRTRCPCCSLPRCWLDKSPGAALHVPASWARCHPVGCPSPSVPSPGLPRSHFKRK